MASEQDVIGPWSEVKLDILREYAVPYSTILSTRNFYHCYIDAFAAGGSHISRKTGAVVQGSAKIALSTQPPFNEYHFIDTSPDRVNQLRALSAGTPHVHVHLGDCNEILLRDVFPRVRYQDHRRGLCLLDPYNIDLSWDVVFTAGQMRSIEVFLNFMVMDMNMNVLLRHPAKADASQIARMDRFWGDRSWREVAYEVSRQASLFEQSEDVKVEDANEKIAEAYRARLMHVAGSSLSLRRFDSSTPCDEQSITFSLPHQTRQARRSLSKFSKNIALDRGFNDG